MRRTGFAVIGGGVCHTVRTAATRRILHLDAMCRYCAEDFAVGESLASFWQPGYAPLDLRKMEKHVRTTVARRVIAGAALVIGLPLATAGLAAAQSGGNSGPSGGNSGPSGGNSSTTSTSTATSLLTTTTARTGTGGTSLPRTGGDLALPIAAAGGAIAVVLGGRRLASRV